MTNEEKYKLNLGIAELVFPDNKTDKDPMDDGIMIILGDKPLAYTIVNYTDNWNDLMELVVEHGINLWKGQSHWHSNWFTQSMEEMVVANKNPHYALAQCLLAVLKEKDDG